MNKITNALALSALLGACSPEQIDTASTNERLMVENSPPLCVARAVSKAMLEKLPSEGVTLYQDGKADFAAAYYWEDLANAMISDGGPDTAVADYTHTWMQLDLNTPQSSSGFNSYFDGETAAQGGVYFDGGHQSHSYEGDREELVQFKEECGYTDFEADEIKVVAVEPDTWPNEFHTLLEEEQIPMEHAACLNTAETIKAIVKAKNYSSSVLSQASRIAGDQYRNDDNTPQPDPSNSFLGSDQWTDQEGTISCSYTKLYFNN